MPDPSRRAHALLVEDSEDDAFFFRWTLRKSGVACDLVHELDGLPAVAYLSEVRQGRKPRPDAVFLDLKLPRFGGFDVLAWMREHPFEPRLRVIVLSGSDHASDVQRAQELGATGYIVKPIQLEQLRHWLELPADAGRSTASAA